MIETSSIILLAVMLAAIVVSGLTVIINMSIAKTDQELSSWAGWVSGFFIRMTTLSLLALAKFAILAQYPLMKGIVEKALLIFAAIIFIGMLIDVYISLYILKKHDSFAAGAGALS